MLLISTNKNTCVRLSIISLDLFVYKSNLHKSFYSIPKSTRACIFPEQLIILCDKHVNIRVISLVIKKHCWKWKM